MQLGDKVLPREPELLGSVFFCFGGHGGSFRSTKRNSKSLQKNPCDLCSKPHTPRPPRDCSAANTATSWVSWLVEDNNNTERFANTATHSLEHDRILCEDDEVVTPFGFGRIVRRQSVAGTAGAAAHAPWPASAFPLVAGSGQYTSPYVCCCCSPSHGNGMAWDAFATHTPARRARDW